MSTIALPSDWEIKPMPDETETIDFQRVFSAAEFERVKIGLVPREMEDKWFIYYHNNTQYNQANNAYDISISIKK